MQALSDLGCHVEDVEWDLLRTVHEELNAKPQRQADIIRPLTERLAKWRSLIDSTKAALNDGLKARAPVFTEEAEVQRLGACVAAAEREVREQQFRLLTQSLNRLPPDKDAEDLRERIRAKTTATHRYSRQADLLVQRTPLEGRYHYTMLLRTASEPGTHGINIQDSSTLVEGDCARTARRISGQPRHSADAKQARPCANVLPAPVPCCSWSPTSASSAWDCRIR